jgi:hypothetical protein
VYASPSYCSQVAPLRTGRNTRYGWVANPYPTGTLTRQDTPSLLGAITIKIVSGVEQSGIPDTIGWTKPLSGSYGDSIGRLSRIKCVFPPAMVAL